jgi:hypothetical protein
VWHDARGTAMNISIHTVDLGGTDDRACSEQWGLSEPHHGYVNVQETNFSLSQASDVRVRDYLPQLTPLRRWKMKMKWKGRGRAHWVLARQSMTHFAIHGVIHHQFRMRVKSCSCSTARGKEPDCVKRHSKKIDKSQNPA